MYPYAEKGIHTAIILHFADPAQPILDLPAVSSTKIAAKNLLSSSTTSDRLGGACVSLDCFKKALHWICLAESLPKAVESPTGLSSICIPLFSNVRLIATARTSIFSSLCRVNSQRSKFLHPGIQQAEMDERLELLCDHSLSAVAGECRRGKVEDRWVDKFLGARCHYVPETDVDLHV